MTPKRSKDTDTLTRFDAAPDAPTVRQDWPGADAETHRIEPRAWAPLRVCPSCSLAWEVTGEWCPSCGTAFEKQLRESSTPTRVMPPRRSEPPLTRSARKAASAPPQQPPRSGPPTRQRPEASGGSGKTVFTALAVCVAVIGAFFIGQLSRPSDAEIDRSTAEAVQTARQSAAKSYRRAFDKMQAEAQAAIDAAREKGLAEGKADAQQQVQEQLDNSQSLFDSVTQCVLHGQC